MDLDGIIERNEAQEMAADRREALEERNKELERRLDEIMKYVNHDESCAILNSSFRVGCDCGFYDYLTKLKEAGKFGIK